MSEEVIEYKKIKVTCEKCGHEWMSTYNEHKIYYLCPVCRHYNKLKKE